MHSTLYKSQLYFITKDDVLPQLTIKEDSARKEGIQLEGSTFKEIKSNFERSFLLKELEENHWNISAIAKKLGMQQPNLSRKIKELGLSK
jgi:transcriptional regulator with PAS, ATPase and Fis domain